jgi:hypothetical protein
VSVLASRRGCDLDLKSAIMRARSFRDRHTNRRAWLSFAADEINISAQKLGAEV